VRFDDPYLAVVDRVGEWLVRPYLAVVDRDGRKRGGDVPLACGGLLLPTARGFSVFCGDERSPAVTWQAVACEP
jgi:hypothetical protein